MRLAMLLAWMAVPLLFAFYHFGPGQDGVSNDLAGTQLRQASLELKDANWNVADAACTEALASLKTDDRTIEQRIRLERAKARMLSQQLPAAYDDLTSLLGELEGEKDADPQLLAETQSAMASAEYYVTWLMRLEGEPRENWELEIEAARQRYRMLYEQASEAGDEAAANEYAENVEAAVRLARMDLTDLEALDLPSQCKSCCSGNCNCKCKKPGKKPGGKKKSEDARGASSGPPADGKGS
jgi:hypothetical protein